MNQLNALSNRVEYCDDLYKIALPGTHLRRCGRFVTPVQVFDLIRIRRDHPGTMLGNMSHDFGALVLSSKLYQPADWLTRWGVSE